MARSIKVLSADMDDKGNLVAGIEVTKADGSTYQRNWIVPATAVATLGSAADIATAVANYIKDMWPSTPTWVEGFVGTTITL